MIVVARSVGDVRDLLLGVRVIPELTEQKHRAALGRASLVDGIRIPRAYVSLVTVIDLRLRYTEECVMSEDTSRVIYGNVDLLAVLIRDGVFADGDQILPADARCGIFCSVGKDKSVVSSAYLDPSDRLAKLEM